MARVFALAEPPAPEFAAFREFIREMEDYHRNLHAINLVQSSLGAPVVNRQLEEQFKELGLWPEEAAPAPFNVAEAVILLRFNVRVAVYGLLMGLDIRDLAKHRRVTPGAIRNDLNAIKLGFKFLAQCFRLVEPTWVTADGIVRWSPLRQMLELNHPALSALVHRAGLTRIRLPNGDEGISLDDFPTLWALYIRRWAEIEDSPH